MAPHSPFLSFVPISQTHRQMYKKLVKGQYYNRLCQWNMLRKYFFCFSTLTFHDPFMQPEIELIFNYVVIFVSIEFHIENDSKKSKNSVTLEGKLIETISN